MGTHVHAHTHTHTHTLTHTHTHALTHTLTHAHAHKHTCTRTPTHTHTRLIPSPPSRFPHEPHVALFSQIFSGEVEEGVFTHWLQTQTALTEAFSQQQEDQVE